MEHGNGGLFIPAPMCKEDLERLGRRLRDTLLHKQRLEQRKAEAIARVNDRFGHDINAAEREASALVDVIVNYVNPNKDDLTDTQTLLLHSMKIEWKEDGKGTLVYDQSEEVVVGRLKRIGATRLIRIKMEVKKDELKNDAAILKKLKGLVHVVYKPTITVTPLPTKAQQERGIKLPKRDRAL